MVIKKYIFGVIVCMIISLICSIVFHFINDKVAKGILFGVSIATFVASEVISYYALRNCSKM